VTFSFSRVRQLCTLSDKYIGEPGRVVTRSILPFASKRHHPKQCLRRGMKQPHLILMGTSSPTSLFQSVLSGSTKTCKPNSAMCYASLCLRRAGDQGYDKLGGQHKGRHSYPCFRAQMFRTKGRFGLNTFLFWHR
jgi:hypothetical protein